MKKLKIGIDIDNVIADTGTMFLTRFNSEFKTTITYEEVEHFGYFDTYTGIDQQKIKQFTDTILSEDSFFDSLDPYREALDVISRWNTQGHSIHFITARSVVSDAVTKKWLKRHGFLLSGVTLDLYDESIHEKEGGYKNVVAQRIGLDLMIEDDMSYTKALEVPVLLLDRPWNRTALPKHAKRMKDWKEIEETVANMK